MSNESSTIAIEAAPAHSAEPAFVTRKVAAEYLKSRYGYGTEKWLAKLASVGGGPVYRKSSGRMALYRLADIDAWALGRMSAPISSTSDKAA